MLFNSAQYLIFLPVVLLVYYFLPKKVSYLWLLAASYYFYMCWNAVYVLLILTSTIVTYLCGLWIGHAETKKIKKLSVCLCLIINLGILVYFKYFNFAMDVVTSIGELLNIRLSVPKADVLLPVGISFYTFQALGYTIDVYRERVPAERNFFRYALFVSFFPQLVAGPIERTGNLLSQLKEKKKFSFNNFREGYLLILWGMFLKIVLADRIAIFVDRVYGKYTTYSGWYLIVATVLFAVQILCDFNGYSTIAMGSAKMLGIQLMDNFDAPYLSTSVAHFWRRWHISLTSWFKDYLYIPLGGSRKGKLRKHINRMIVFLVSGLWHGANLSFLAWGGLNGLYQVLGEILRPVRDRLKKVFHIHSSSFGHQLLCGVITFILIDFSWIFFRAQSVSEAFQIISLMFSKANPWILFDGALYKLGLDEKSFHLTMNAIIILLAVDISRRKGINLREVFFRQDYWFRWLIIALATAAVIIFGVWGPGYDQANFIYFQF